MNNIALKAKKGKIDLDPNKPLLIRLGWGENMNIKIQYLN